MQTELVDNPTRPPAPRSASQPESPDPSQPSAAPLRVFRAESDADKEAAYQFRYSIYVEEMGRYRHTADHARRMLIDPEDSHSVIYVACEGSDVVGTLRTTFGEDGFSDRQISQYSLEPFLAQIPARLMCVSERLMVAPRLRGSSAMTEMRDRLAELIDRRQVKIIFGDCEPHFLAHNLTLGSRPYAERNINSEDAGYLIPLITFPDGTDGLAQAITRAEEDAELPPIIRQVLAGTGVVISSAIADPQTYRSLIDADLKRLAATALHTFAGFDDDELQKCIQRSTIIACSRGDRLLKKGGSSNNLFVVLSGTLEVRDADTVINKLTAGDMFGETAFLLGVPRQRDVIAVTDDARVLSLGDRAIRRLITDESALAAKLLLNLSKMLSDRLVTTTDRITA